MKKHLLLSIFLIFYLYNTRAQFNEDGPEIILTETSDDAEYGFTPEKAVKVGTISNEYNYLSMLKGPNGEAVSYSRISSCCGFNCPTCPFKMGLLDKWEVKYAGQKEPVIVYTNGYQYENPLCIKGFSFTGADSSLINIPTVLPCKGKVYGVESTQLESSFGKLPKPDNAPRYTSQEEKLVSYFMQNPLTDEEAEKIVFKVEIALLINCNGEAGNYKVISKGRGTYKTLANKILALVTKMPDKWVPATKGKKTIDCYQVLSFKVVDGKLYNVTYAQ